MSIVRGQLFELSGQDADAGADVIRGVDYVS
jgi:hypothetical protein